MRRWIRSALVQIMTWRGANPLPNQCWVGVNCTLRNKLQCDYIQNIILSMKFIWKYRLRNTVYPKKYAHGFCFAVLCCGYTLTDFPISIRLTSLALWQSNDCPSASKATLMNMDKYFMWIRYERLHNHNKAKHNKTVCIFLGIYCSGYLHLVQRVMSYNETNSIIPIYLNDKMLWILNPTFKIQICNLFILR